MSSRYLIFALLALVVAAPLEAGDQRKLTPDQLEKTRKCYPARFENTFLGKRTSRSINICRIKMGELIVSAHANSISEVDSRLKALGSSEAWTQGSSDAGSPSSRLCKELAGEYRLGRLIQNKRALNTDLCFFGENVFANSAYLMWRKGRL
jgi:hypothetical protein